MPAPGASIERALVEHENSMVMVRLATDAVELIDSGALPGVEIPGNGTSSFFYRACRAL